MIPLMVYAYQNYVNYLREYFATKDLRITIDKEINFNLRGVLIKKIFTFWKLKL